MKNLFAAPLVLILVVCTSATAEQIPTFARDQVSGSNVGYLIDVSPDNQVITVIASDLTAWTYRNRSKDRKSYWLAVPIRGAARGAAIEVTLEGTASRPREAKTRLSLLIRVNGRVKVFNFSTDPDGPFDRKVRVAFSRLAHARFAIELRAERLGGSREAQAVLAVDSMELLLTSK